MARELDPEIWEKCDHWTQTLGSLIYNETAAGLPAYLDLEDERLEQAARTIGGGVGNSRQALIDAVKATLNPPSHPAGLFGRQLVRLRDWTQDPAGSPPHLALLGVMSLAAEEMHRGEGYAPNNYYDRLMPLIGVATPEDKKRVINSYRACSRELWDALNHWLEDLQGERGLPTAFSYTHAHVGLPMSQALVRAADRDRLTRFFLDSGFAPRSRVPPEEMKLLLDEWMARTPPRASKSLLRLWESAAARERVLEIASLLLETWEGPDGYVGDEGAERTHRLSLTVLIRSFPTVGLEFNAIGMGTVDDQLRLPDLKGGNKAGVQIAVEEIPGRRFRLASADTFDSRSLLEGKLELKDASDRTFERRPRRLVPLHKDHLIQAFVETERLQLGEDGIVLCQDVIAASVDDALSLIARPGFERWAAGSEKCPEGWQLFRNIQIVTPLPPSNPKTGKLWPLELNGLQPLATSHVLLEGGLQFPGHVRGWSTLAPPELRITTEDAQGLLMRVEQVRSLDGQVDPIETKFESPVAVAQVRDLNLTDGDYEVTAITSGAAAQDKGRSIDTVRLRLRSGDTPNVGLQPEHPLVRDFTSPARAVLTGSRVEQPLSFLEPLDPTQDQGTEVAHADSQPLTPIWWTRRHDSSEETERSTAVRILIPPAEPSDCINTGAHRMQLPDTVDVRGATFQGYCKYCGLVKRYPSRYRRGARLTRAKKSTAPVAPSFDVKDMPPVVSQSDVTPESALDALTHIGRGPGSALKQVALQIEPSQLFADSFVRALEALCHVELERQIEGLSISGWETIPPALMELPSSEYVFVGERSRRLCDALGERVGAMGGELVRQHQSAAPDVLLVRGLGGDGIQILAKAIGDRVGREVLIVRRAALRLASLLPSLSEVTAEIPQRPMVGFRSARRWNGSLARWERVDDASVPGAYQLFASRTVYCVRDSADIDRGSMRPGDARLVKYWNALGNGSSLVGYDAPSATLYAPLGAELPFLYSRAAVLSSGLLPSVDEKQRVVRYSSVEPAVAGRLIQLLSS